MTDILANIEAEEAVIGSILLDVSMFSQVNLDKKDFYVQRSELFKIYMEEHPDYKKDYELIRGQERTLLDFINGERSVTKIWKWTMAETSTAMSLDDVTGYMKFLKDIGWIDY